MWNKIIGQERQKDILKEIFKNKKIAHAYLFFGTAGIGKDAMAIEFGKLVNCENPNNANACDECKSCKQFNSFNSPYLSFITALPTLKEEDEDMSSSRSKKSDPVYEVLRDELAKKSNDIYHKINIPKANNILIESIRKIKNDAYLTSTKDRTKVFIISDADKMNTQSSNAFLKILEEPPKHSLFILTTSRLDAIVPTISGRCQKLKFDNLKTDEVETYISSLNSSISKTDKEFISRLAGGSILRCREIMNNDIPILRESVLKSLLYLLTGENNLLGKEINELVSKKDKAVLKTFLMLLTIWFRDAACIKSGMNEKLMFNDVSERLEKFSSNYDFKSYRIIKTIEDAGLDIDRNINPELLLFRLFFTIKSELSKTAKKL